jgi:hypothetical protein
MPAVRNPDVDSVVLEPREPVEDAGNPSTTAAEPACSSAAQIDVSGVSGPE